MDVIAALLQQIAVQTSSFSVNAGFINSTTTFPSPATLPPFQPSTNAVRTNVLWFASLILSLISASFGMLVKQWLREYLAGEYTSPQARIRIRHFRNPSLTDWKVFEIAALLPLLLQLALMTFFVGLCFFTADVHSSIANTTLPLVIAWVVFFVAVSFAPVLSPRCPYKTAFLKSLTKVLRMKLHAFLSILSSCKPFGRSTIGDSGPPAKDSEPQLKHTWDRGHLVYDEETVLRDDKNDIDILAAVDAIQSDDGLLELMWGALKQARLESEETLGFLMRVIGHRVEGGRISESSSSILNLRHLSKQTCFTIMDLAAGVLKQELVRDVPVEQNETRTLSSCSQSCLYLLLSDFSSPIPESAQQALELVLSGGRHKSLIQAKLKWLNNNQMFPHFLHRFQGSFDQLDADTLPVLFDLFNAAYCSENHSHQTLGNILLDHAEVPAVCWQVVFKVMIKSLRMPFRLNEPKHFDYHNNHLAFVLLLGRVQELRKNILTYLVQEVLRTHTYIGTVWKCAIGLHQPSGSFKDGVRELFTDAFIVANSAGQLILCTSMRRYHSSISLTQNAPPSSPNLPQSRNSSTHETKQQRVRAGDSSGWILCRVATSTCVSSTQFVIVVSLPRSTKPFGKGYGKPRSWI